MYLGHYIDKNGIHTDAEKVKAIDELKTLINVKGVRQSIGMVSWYKRFIPHCSEMVKPLILLQKKEKWCWEEREWKAFDQFKEELKSAPVLVPPDFEKLFTSQTNASSEDLGAVLMQVKKDQEHVKT